MPSNGLPPRLEEIVADFELCQGNEKLEYLLELSESLEPLPKWLTERRDKMDEVHECLTPVFVYAEQDDAGRLTYHIDVPPDAPTVRGFAAILQQGLNGVTQAEVLAVPGEFYLATGLQTVLSGQRLNGMSALLAHMKRLAVHA
jgi:cysteine desulfuration protein SufE